MRPGRRPSFADDFRRFFFRGLGVLLPSLLTLWILVQAYFFLEARVAEPINRGVRAAVVWATPRMLPRSVHPAWMVVSAEELQQFRTALETGGDPGSRALTRLPDRELAAELRRQELERLWNSNAALRLLGLVVAIVLIYLAGRFLGSLIGRQVYQRLERFIARIPVFKQVYPHVKQLVDLVLGERSMAFKRVVLVEYPRRGIWSLGFVTGGGLRGTDAAAGGEVVTVFVPSTPTPFTGFTISVPAADALEVAISIDEAIRFILTGGVLTPSNVLPPGAAEAAPAGAAAPEQTASLPTGAPPPEGLR
ncbi:MAG TPA: DUF502 domain-containing protein [Phycisphaerales bacterium]|nr:DUF502 domain-containing protein [Phycisphaerales bacterium]